MSVEIKIYGDNAREALGELKAFTADFISPLPNVLQAVVAPVAAASSQQLASPTAATGDAQSASTTEPEKPKAESAKEKKAREAAEKKARQITETPEDRQNPEDEAQDAADEAAETATTATAELTHDDVRAALKGYVQAFGMEHAQVDGPKCISMRFGEAKVKVSDIPNTQEDLKQAVADIESMTASNPFKRAPVKAAA